MATNNGNKGQAVAVRQPAVNLAPAAQQAVADIQSVKDMLNLSDELVQRAALLAARLPVPAPKKTQDDDTGRWTQVERFYSLPQLLSAAEMELSTGQQCGRDFYLDPDLGIVSGYRGAQAAVGQTRDDVLTRARPMTDAEAIDYGVIEGDKGFIAEAFNERTGVVLAVGTGIMTRDELWDFYEWKKVDNKWKKLKLASPKPKYPTMHRPRYWKGLKRARTDALNMLIGLRPVRGSDILREARNRGLEVEITDEQADDAGLTVTEAQMHVRLLDYIQDLKRREAAGERIGPSPREQWERTKDAMGWVFMSDDERLEYLRKKMERDEEADSKFLDMVDEAVAVGANPAEAAGVLRRLMELVGEGEVIDLSTAWAAMVSQFASAASGGDASDDDASDDDASDDDVYVSRFASHPEAEKMQRMVEYALQHGAYQTPKDAEQALMNLVDSESAGTVTDLRMAWIDLVKTRSESQEDE